MRILYLVNRIIKQIIGDKRTLALMLIAPLVILTLMNLIFNNSNNQILKVGYYNLNDNIVNSLDNNSITTEKFSNSNDIKNKIETNKLTAFIYMDGNNVNVTYDNSNISNTIAIQSKLGMAISKLTIEDLGSVVKEQGAIIQKQAHILNDKSHMESLNNKAQPLTINNSYVYGSANSTLFDSMVPVLIGFFVFFFVFLISGMSLLKERTSGTLDKLLATPIKRYEIVLGYLFGYGIFAIIQTIIIVAFSVFILKISIAGSIFLVIGVNIVIAFVALALGILLSTFANSEFQMMQFIPIIILPQIFLSGIIPISSMSSSLQDIAKIMPMYYGGEALIDVIIKGFSFDKIFSYIIVLCIFAIIFTVINIIGLRRYRKV
ncbi:MAG: ABC transporter permease [Sarcina sp.]